MRRNRIRNAVLSAAAVTAANAAAERESIRRVARTQLIAVYFHALYMDKVRVIAESIVEACVANVWGTIRRRENQEHRRVRIQQWQDSFMLPENGIRRHHLLQALQIRGRRPPMRPTQRSPRPVLHDTYHDRDSPRAAPPFRPPPGLPPPTGPIPETAAHAPAGPTALSYAESEPHSKPDGQPGQPDQLTELNQMD